MVHVSVMMVPLVGEVNGDECIADRLHVQVWVRCPVSSGVIRGWGCFLLAGPLMSFGIVFGLAADTVMAGILFDDFASGNAGTDLANMRALFDPATQTSFSAR